MAKIDKEKLRVDPKSLDIKKQNLERLKEIFPAAFSEGKVDFKKLETLLGEDVEKGIERYSFTWPGKSNAIKEISAPSLGTLKPVRDESVNFDDTENLFIEADNLEALKLLQKSYLGKIKMIYIDPPYNTGKDFVYKDNFGETLKDYLEFTSQKDEAGKVFTTNPDSAGRFHSNWLNMMYPRLYLARNLMADDGAIFISIDDNEFVNLKKICDEIFGENNYLNNFCWLNNLKGRQISNFGAAKTYESVLCYAKNIASAQLFSGDVDRLKEVMPSAYKGFDYDVESDEKGDYVIKNELYNTNSFFNEKTRPNLVYNIHYNPNTQAVEFSSIFENKTFDGYVKVSPKTNNNGVHQYHAWRWSKDKVVKDITDLKFIKSGETYKIYTKIRDHKVTALKDIITDISTSKGSKEVLSLFKNEKFFDYPKPTDLIKTFVSMAGDSDIILDFFAGSGTTAHAVMNANLEDGGNRKFIVVQLPELTDERSEAFKAGYKNIADIAKERIRRVIDKIIKDAERQPKLLSAEQDFGLKIFKLDKSNFNVWDGTDPENLDAQLQLGVDRVDTVSSDEDILYEVMLKDGFMLSEKPEIKTVDGKKIYSFGEGFLLVCLEKKLTKEFIKQMAELMPKTESDATVIFLDEGFHDNDQLLVNAVEIFKSRNEKINFRIV